MNNNLATIEQICETFDARVIWDIVGMDESDQYSQLCFIGDKGDPSVGIDPYFLTPGHTNEAMLADYIRTPEGQVAINKAADEIFYDWDVKTRDWKD